MSDDAAAKAKAREEIRARLALRKSAAAKAEADNAAATAAAPSAVVSLTVSGSDVVAPAPSAAKDAGDTVTARKTREASLVTSAGNLSPRGPIAVATGSSRRVSGVGPVSSSSSAGSGSTPLSTSSPGSSAAALGTSGGSGPASTTAPVAAGVSESSKLRGKLDSAASRKSRPGSVAGSPLGSLIEEDAPLSRGSLKDVSGGATVATAEDKEKLRVRMQLRKENLSRSSGSASPLSGSINVVAGAGLVGRDEKDDSTASKTSPRPQGSVSPRRALATDEISAPTSTSPKPAALATVLASELRNSGTSGRASAVAAVAPSASTGAVSAPSAAPDARRAVDVVVPKRNSLSYAPVTAAFAETDAFGSISPSAPAAADGTVSAEVQLKIDHCKAVHETLIEATKGGQLTLYVDGEWCMLCADWEALLAKGAGVASIKNGLELSFADSLARWAEFRLASPAFRFKAAAVIDKCDRAEAIVRVLVNAQYVSWGAGNAYAVLDAAASARKKALATDAAALAHLAVQLQQQLREMEVLKRSISDKQARLTKLGAK